MIITEKSFCGSGGKWCKKWSQIHWEHLQLWDGRVPAVFWSDREDREADFGELHSARRLLLYAPELRIVLTFLKITWPAKPKILSVHRESLLTRGLRHWSWLRVCWGDMGAREAGVSVEGQFHGSILGLILTFPVSHTSFSLSFLSFRWFYLLNRGAVLNSYASCPQCCTLPGSFSTSPLSRLLGVIYKAFLPCNFATSVKLSLGSTPLHPSSCSQPWCSCPGLVLCSGCGQVLLLHICPPSGPSCPPGRCTLLSSPVNTCSSLHLAQHLLSF